MEKIEAPGSDERKIKFSFPQPQRSGLKVITIQDVHHAYGPNVVYRSLHFRAERGQRIVLVGPNGAGKSTLLKITAGAFSVPSAARPPPRHITARPSSHYLGGEVEVGGAGVVEGVQPPPPPPHGIIR